MLDAMSGDLQGWLEELVGELRRRGKERREAIASHGPVSALMHPSWPYMLQKIDEASSNTADEWSPPWRSRRCDVC